MDSAPVLLRSRRLLLPPNHHPVRIGDSLVFEKHQKAVPGALYAIYHMSIFLSFLAKQLAYKVISMRFSHGCPQPLALESMR